MLDGAPWFDAVSLELSEQLVEAGGAKQFAVEHRYPSVVEFDAVIGDDGVERTRIIPEAAYPFSRLAARSRYTAGTPRRTRSLRRRVPGVLR